MEFQKAHEYNHNVRFQFTKWSNSITLEEKMINEGLAERMLRRGLKGVILERSLIACGFNLYKYHNKRNREQHVV